MRTLREARASYPLSMRELSRKAGIALETLRGIESGERLAQPGTIRKLSTALDVQPGEVAEFVAAMEYAARKAGE